MTRVEDIRDRANRIIGTIYKRPNGQLQINDARNTPLGTYDPTRNETRTWGNAFVSKGNTLMTLLR